MNMHASGSPAVAASFYEKNCAHAYNKYSPIATTMHDGIEALATRATVPQMATMTRWRIFLQFEEPRRAKWV